MKQIILILSMLIAAFVMACSDGKKSLKLRNGGQSNQKTLEQMEKASSDESLKKMVEDLVKKQDLQVPDIIAVVNRSFGTTIKQQPASKDGLQVTLQKAGTSDQTDSKPQVEPQKDLSALKDIDLEDAMTVGEVRKAQTPSGESKSICVGNCQIQIRIDKTLHSSKKLTSIRAFVIAKLDAKNANIISSKLNNKSFGQILALYDASTKLIDVRILLIKKSSTKSERLEIQLEPYIYQEQGMSEASFVVSSTGDTGSAKLIRNDEKFLRLGFDLDDDLVNIKLLDDYGILGRNQSERTDDSGDQKSQQKSSLT